LSEVLSILLNGEISFDAEGLFSKCKAELRNESVACFIFFAGFFSKRLSRDLSGSPKGSNYSIRTIISTDL